MRLTELHADLQTVRENLAAELAGINRYEAQAFSLADEHAKEVVQRIADDKKEHVARLLDLLRRLDVKQREKIERTGPLAG
jgi:rubrerythrin